MTSHKDKSQIRSAPMTQMCYSESNLEHALNFNAMHIRCHSDADGVSKDQPEGDAEADADSKSDSYDEHQTTPWSNSGRHLQSVYDLEDQHHVTSYPVDNLESEGLAVDLASSVTPAAAAAVAPVAPAPHLKSRAVDLSWEMLTQL